MIIMSVNDYAKYSFLDIVGNYVKEMGISNIAELDDPKYNNAFERAVERIRNSVDNKLYIPNLEEPNTEIISFLISTMLLKLSNNIRLIKRFALYESKGVEKSLGLDISKNNEIAVEIINSFYSDTMKKVGKYYSISIPNYLTHSTDLNAPEWKLVNQRVDSGYVLLDRSSLVRLLRTQISNYLISKIKKISVKPTQKLADYTKRIEGMLEPAEFKMSKEYPPCVKHAISVMNRGDNLSHSGRLLLATYMFARGMEIENIIEFYRNAPDFNEKVTTYQLEQLSGEVGSGIKYNCPSCSNLDTKGLCYKTEECGRIVNPIQFKSFSSKN